MPIYGILNRKTGEIEYVKFSLSGMKAKLTNRALHPRYWEDPKERPFDKENVLKRIPEEWEICELVPGPVRESARDSVRASKVFQKRVPDHAEPKKGQAPIA